MGCLYKIEFPNGKLYIGICKHSAEKRFRSHSKNKMPVGFAIRKFGKASVELTTLVIAEWSYLKVLEKAAIKSFGSKAPNGYNLTDGGEGILGYKRTSEETKAMSEITSNRFKDIAERLKMSALVKGFKHSKEARESMSASHKGIPLSAAHREAISRGNKGVKKKPLSDSHRAALSAAMKGRTFSASHRAALSAALKGKKKPERKD